ncbi:MAG TPA: sulfotransferase [Solirubrobacteraceae bacterium]|jgi:hypothetical protein
MAPASPEEDLRPSKPKVIYVMGAGRSGSTILGVALGNCDGIFFAGELDKWLPRAGEPTRKDAARVAFWERVRARMGDPEILVGARPRRYLERSSALFRVDRLRALARLRAPYREATSELFGAIATTAGADYVVDSSHYPLRAHELQSLTEIELYLVLLVRSPQSVIASFAKDDVAERRFSPVTTRAYLLLTYLLAARVFRAQPSEQRLVLLYEDLLEDPVGVLSELLDRVGSTAQVPDLGALATGVPLHGNRLLGAEVVALGAASAQRGKGSGGGFGARLFSRLLLAGLSQLKPRISGRPSAAARAARDAATPAR